MSFQQHWRRSTRRRPRRALWLPAAFALLTAASLAFPTDGADAQSKKRRPVTHTIVMEGTSFEPASLSVTLGDRIEWVNRDFFAHTATASGDFDSGILPAGKSWTHTPDARGEIEYVCTLHPTMKGTLTVK